MRKLRTYAVSTAVLCLLTALGMVASALALTDIFHAVEPDLQLEWQTVRWTFVSTALLIISAAMLARAGLSRPRTGYPAEPHSEG